MKVSTYEALDTVLYEIVSRSNGLSSREIVRILLEEYTVSRVGVTPKMVSVRLQRIDGVEYDHERRVFYTPEPTSL